MTIEVSHSYRYCPICGASRSSYAPPRPFQCESCLHTSYFGPVAAVGGILTNESGQVLLIIRARDPGRGLLGMPGGFVDPGEPAEEALRREVFEEVGLQINSPRFLVTAPNRYIYNGVEHPVLDLFFHARIDSTQSVAPEATEVTDWFWTELNDSVLDRLAFDSNRLALLHYRDHWVENAE